MPYKKYKIIEHEGTNYKISNRLYNVILREINVPDIKQFFEKYKDFSSIINIGVKTEKELNNLFLKIYGAKKNNSKSQKREFSQIRIPPELYKLPIQKLNLFKNDFEDFRKAINGASNTLEFFSSLDGRTSLDLKSIKGMGVKKVEPIWNWFLSFHSGSYAEISQYILKDNDNLKFSDIHFSFYLNQFFKKNKIRKIQDLAIIDNIDFSELNKLDLLCLLELRTIYKNTKNQFQTRTNHTTKEFNLFCYFDNFFELQASSSKKILKQRYDHKEPNSLKDVGEKNGYTRERARQILELIREYFLNDYIYDFESFTIEIKKKFIENLSPLTIEELGANDKKYDLTHKKDLYKNFFNELFHPIPFYKAWEASSATFWNSISIISVTKKELKKSNRIKLTTHLRKFDLDSQIQLLNYALNPYGTIDILDRKYFVLNAYRSSKWDKMFKNFENFILENNKIPRGDKRIVTHISEEEYKLGRWLRKERMSYKNGTLGNYRLTKIIAIYPEFKKRKRAKKKTWLDSYKDYKIFKNKYGKEPNQKGSIAKNETRLGLWVSQNKQRYNGTSRNNSPLSAEQISLLKKINFDFNFSEKNITDWENRFEKLKNLGAKKFTKKYIGKSLYIWLQNQNNSYKKGKIQAWKQQKLESIGFKFSHDKNIDKWNKSIEDLINQPLNTKNPKYKWYAQRRRSFKNNALTTYKIIQFLNNNIPLPIETIEINWNEYYLTAKDALQNHNKINKEVLEKPNTLYTWLIYNYCLMKTGNLRGDKLFKYQELNVTKSFFNE
tara:strand:- start:702 stop:3038 length:2337 start_codon:yes stop_codon:yes gene_type:complete